MQNLNCSTTSNGSDNIPTSVLKYSAFAISEPLAHIINYSIICGVFQPQLKSSTIIPIFKAKDRTIRAQSNNSKIIEMIVYTSDY